MGQSSLNSKLRVRFFERLKFHGSISRACEEIGISRNVIKRAAQDNPHFLKRLNEAREFAFTEGLEREARRRAVEGVQKVVVSMGRVVKHRGKPVVETTYSDGLLTMLMRGNMEKYQQKTDVTSGGKALNNQPINIGVTVGGKVATRSTL